MRLVKVLFILIVSLILSSCITPSEQVDAEAVSYGFEKRTISGSRFFHRIYLNNKNYKLKLMHVYIEGDGLAWLTPTMISPEPTPRNPLMLRLMAKDDNAAIYLGRPCYFGLAEVKPCESQWWTNKRFAIEVVESMSRAIEKTIPNDTRLVLIGHSGGGALAMLIAAKSTKVQEVVTLAGILDTEAWTEYHHYGRLNGSLNPANLPVFNQKLKQLHIQGGKDQNIPPILLAQFVTKQPYSDFRVLPEFDHYCCWEKNWPEFLQLIVNTRN
jgi:Lipase (class 3)